MKIKHTFKTIPVFLMLLLATGCSKAGGKTANQQTEKPKTVIRYATSVGNLPINFGITKGFFAEQGLDVKVVTVSGGVEAVTAAAAGEAELGAWGRPSWWVPLQECRSRLSGHRRRWPALCPGLEAPVQETGRIERKAGQSRSPGQGTIQAFNVIARAKGFKPSDFQNVNAGTTANALAALQAGKVEAIITSETVGVKAELEGFGKMLERAADYFGRYQHSFIFTTNQFIKEKPEAVRGFLAAYRKTVEYLKAHPEEAIQFAIKDLEQDEIPYRTVYGKEIPTWDTSGRIDFEGTENAIKILKELGEIDPKVQITAKQIVDEQFLK